MSSFKLSLDLFLLWPGFQFELKELKRRQEEEERRRQEEIIKRSPPPQPQQVERPDGAEKSETASIKSGSKSSAVSLSLLIRSKFEDFFSISSWKLRNVLKADPLYLNFRAQSKINHFQFFVASSRNHNLLFPWTSLTWVGFGGTGVELFWAVVVVAQLKVVAWKPGVKMIKQQQPTLVNNNTHSSNDINLICCKNISSF